MPRGKKTAVKRRSTSKRKFATPIRARKAPAKRKAAPRKAARVVQTRTSAKSVVLAKFESLQSEVDGLRKLMIQAIDIQKSAIQDNYRNYYVATQKGPEDFLQLIARTANAAGVQHEDLEDAVSDLKEEPEPGLTVTQQPGVNVHISNNNVPETPMPDSLNVL